MVIIFDSTTIKSATFGQLRRNSHDALEQQSKERWMARLLQQLSAIHLDQPADSPAKLELSLQKIREHWNLEI